MYRTRTCGELRLNDAGSIVTLAGWVQRSRKMGGMTFVDLRDRYGITQLVFNEEDNAELCERANHLGREFVIQVSGKVNERFSKNPNIPTGRCRNHRIGIECFKFGFDSAVYYRRQYRRR